MGTALVTDSTACLGAQLVAGLAVEVVPLHVVVGGREFAEGVDIGAAEVAAALRSFTPVSTSRPAPQAFLDAYERAAARGADAIVSVHISADMSSTLGSAKLAAAGSPVPVTIIDSRTMGLALGYAVVAGAELAEAGASAAEVAALVEARVAESSVVFYVDTLEHLRRGGRIGTANALLGSALGIKPILAVRDGHIVPVEKVRTASRAIARLEELAIEAAGRAPAAADGVDLAVHHLASAGRAEVLAGRLRAGVPRQHETRVVELGPVVGAHVGPGTLAVAICPRVPPA